MDTALITGGSRGIGLGIAREFAKAGFNLAINGVREARHVVPVLEELGKTGIRVNYYQGDISVPGDRKKICEEISQQMGAVHILVNNAGVAPEERTDIMESTEESFDHVLGVNLKGPYFLTQLFAHRMVQIKSEDPSRFCCVINVSSISSTVASVNRGEYCISKAGLSMTTALWAVRLGEFGIPVYEIQPGIVRTDMTKGVAEKYDTMINEGLCIQQRWGLPEDVGKVAAAMATGSMPYSTGQVVKVDGGLTLRRL